MNLGDVQIGERGYYSLQQNPEYLKAVNGKTKKMICIKYYDNMTPYGPFSAVVDYILGEPGMSIKNLIVTLWIADQPSVSQSPLAGVKRFMMNTGKTKVTFHLDGGHRCFLAFSSGNGIPWLALYSQNSVNSSLQKLGTVSVAKDGDDACVITAAQWSHGMIIPLNGTVEIAHVQPSVSHTTLGYFHESQINFNLESLGLAAGVYFMVGKGNYESDKYLGLMEHIGKKVFLTKLTGSAYDISVSGTTVTVARCPYYTSWYAVKICQPSVCQREFVVKAVASSSVTFTVSGWDDGIYYIIGAAPFAETAAFSDAMVRVLEGKPYVQSLHGNVSLSGDTITVSGDGWYTYVVKFLLTNLQQHSVSRSMKYTIDSAEKDLDKLVSFGVYSVKSPVSAPSGVTDWANVIVVPTNGSAVYVAQVLVTHGGVVYSRGKGGGDWSIWKVLKRDPV